MLYRISIVFVAMLFIVGMAHALVLDFESGDLSDWEVIDDVDLGDADPGAWEIRDSELGLDGKALYQGSNIWGDTTDSCLMGTMIIYKGQEFSDFTMEVDVAADDNDGMGIVWAFDSLEKHYRVAMINDVWPDTALDGVNGPFLKMSKRIGNDSPWYNMMAVVKDDYVPYEENAARLHWTLTVDNGAFTFVREDGLSISAADGDYGSGFVGFQLYAQQLEIDNIVITPLDAAAVDPMDKTATMWGAIKSD